MQLKNSIAKSTKKGEGGQKISWFGYHPPCTSISLLQRETQTYWNMWINGA